MKATVETEIKTSGAISQSQWRRINDLIYEMSKSEGYVETQIVLVHTLK